MQDRSGVPAAGGTSSGTRARPDRVRFGEFNLDPISGDLSDGAFRVTLAEQPLLLLRALVERPGGLVTRDELRHRLWPADTFVDCEHGLNAAVKRLRDALRDSADAPRFIETVPRRGYRFIAPVQGAVGATPASPADATHAHRPAPRRLAPRGALFATTAVHFCCSGKEDFMCSTLPPAKNRPFPAAGACLSPAGLRTVTGSRASPHPEADRLVVYDVARRRWKTLATSWIGWPAGSRDSRWISFRGGRSIMDAMTVYRVRAADGELETVASLEGVRQAWGEQAFWLGLAPDDSPLVLKDASSHELYALEWLAP